jgi:hypothetical protein
MAKRIQFRRGTTAEHATFVGAPGEITIDTTKKIVIVHDGVTPGGFSATQAQTFNGTSRFVGDTSTSISTGSLVIQGGIGLSGNLNYSGRLEKSANGGISSNISRFNIGPTTKLDLHISSNVSGVSPTNTQQYGISFTSGFGQTQAAIVCSENTIDGTAIGIFTSNNYAGTGPRLRTIIDSSGNLLPASTNAHDLGSASLRWRNIFTQDLHLSNGIGDYTIIEGLEDLFLVNNKNNKHYKFSVVEVDPSIVPNKSETQSEDNLNISPEVLPAETISDDNLKNIIELLEEKLKHQQAQIEELKKKV